MNKFQPNWSNNTLKSGFFRISGKTGSRIRNFFGLKPSRDQDGANKKSLAKSVQPFWRSKHTHANIVLLYKRDDMFFQVHCYISVVLNFAYFAYMVTKVIKYYVPIAELKTTEKVLRRCCVTPTVITRLTLILSPKLPQFKFLPNLWPLKQSLGDITRT